MTPPATIIVTYANGSWRAASSDPRQGTITGSPEVILSAVAAWMRGER